MPKHSQHLPSEFAEVLSAPEQPLIVGGQAINLWAEIYANENPRLDSFAPFTSRDADIFGSRALAESLAKRTGWIFEPVKNHDSIVVAKLTKANTADGIPLLIEVLSEINGLTASDLTHSSLVEIKPGEKYLLPSPVVLLKAKLYNLASLGGHHHELCHAHRARPPS